MQTWIPILMGSTYLVVFVVGIAVGVFAYERGYKQGWKASYQVREDPDKGLFQNTGEPGEFEVVDLQEKEGS